MIHAPAVAGRRWPPVKVLEPWTLFLEGCRLEGLGEHWVRAGQLRQLEELAQHAQRYVPYYQDVLAGHDLRHIELEELPILTREALRERREEFLPRRLPSGLRLTGTAHTSGTTGEPVQVNYTNAQNAWYSAHLMRALDWGGFNQSSKLAAIRHITLADDVPQDVRREVQEEYLKGQELPRWDPALLGQIDTGPGFGMSIEQDPRVQYQWLKRIQPAYLISHASNLRYLADLCRQHGAIASLRAVMSVAEALEEHDRDEIEGAMNVHVYDVYSCRELGYIASSCKCGYYHVYDDNVILEVLDEHDKPCSAGDTGRVVLTGLHTFASPLIRYEIGDQATVPAQQSACWRVQSMRSLMSVDGRRLPLFRLLDGARKDPMKLVALVRQAGQDEIARFAIEQTEEAEIVVSAVPTPELDAPRFTVAVTQAVWDFFGSTDVRVKTNLAPRLPLGATGKAPPVVSCRV